MSRAMQPYVFFIGVSSINVWREANPVLQNCGIVLRENSQSMMMGGRRGLVRKKVSIP